MNSIKSSNTNITAHRYIIYYSSLLSLEKSCNYPECAIIRSALNCANFLKIDFPLACLRLPCMAHKEFPLNIGKSAILKSVNPTIHNLTPYSCDRVEGV